MARKSYIKSTRRHTAMNISGCLENTKKGKLTFIDDDSGRALTDTQARMELQQLQAEGYKLMDCSGECYRFDKEKGCPGHIKALMPTEDKMDTIELEYSLFKQGKRI